MDKLLSITFVITIEEQTVEEYFYYGNAALVM